jgi:hypothetical protein
MEFFKKIGMTVVYYIIGFIIDANVNYLFAPGGMSYVGYTIPSIILVSFLLVIISRTLRAERLKKNHKGDDSPEKAIFNGELKGKLQYIVKSKEFKLEFIISIVIGVITIMSPIMTMSFAYGLRAVFAIPSTTVILVLWILLAPFYISALNLCSWLQAYNKAYKRKEF